MTERERIASLADELAHRHETRNPFEIARAEGISVVSCPDFKKLKGMYKVILDRRFVFLNAALSRREARMVLAHELGHDALHREMAESNVVQDFFLLDMTLKPEYEANLFAANLLISAEKLEEVMRNGADVEDAARLFHVTPEYVRLKLGQ